MGGYLPLLFLPGLGGSSGSSGSSRSSGSSVAPIPHFPCGFPFLSSENHVARLSKTVVYSVGTATFRFTTQFGYTLGKCCWTLITHFGWTFPTLL